MAGKKKNTNKGAAMVKYIDIRGGVSIEEGATSRKLKGEKKRVHIAKFKEMVRKEKLICMDVIGYDQVIGGTSYTEDGFFWCPSILEQEEFHREDSETVLIVDDFSKDMYGCVRKKFEELVVASEEAARKSLEEEQAEKQLSLQLKSLQLESQEKEQKNEQLESQEQQSEQQEEQTFGIQGEQEVQAFGNQGEIANPQQDCYLINKGDPISFGDFLSRLDDKLTGVMHGMERMESDIRDLSEKSEKSDIRMVRMENILKDLHSDVSSLSERQSRNAFAAFFKSHNPDFSILYHVARMVLPYSSIHHSSIHRLEKVTQLCGKLVEKWNSSLKKSERSLGSRQIPSHVEIDLVMKVKGREGPFYSSPKSNPIGATTSSSSVVFDFSHLLVGELTRNIKLCNTVGKWEMPTELACTASSKLLYKLVQLERGIWATMHYYNVPISAIAGACLLSPSFRELSDPACLLNVVLNDVGKGLPYLRQLSTRGQLWLMDI